MPEITLLLHNIRSTHNVGSIFRTAEGFGVKQIIISGYTPYPSHANDDRLPHIAKKLDTQISKVALGAEKIVDFKVVDNIENYLVKLSQPIIGLEQSSKSVALHKFEPPDEMTLILGEEVNGIPSEIRKHCTELVEIPMFGQKESFNVSVAAGIALYGLLF